VWLIQVPLNGGPPGATCAYCSCIGNLQLLVLRLVLCALTTMPASALLLPNVAGVCLVTSNLPACSVWGWQQGAAVGPYIQHPQVACLCSVSAPASGDARVGCRLVAAHLRTCSQLHMEGLPGEWGRDGALQFVGVPQVISFANKPGAPQGHNSKLCCAYAEGALCDVYQACCCCTPPSCPPSQLQLRLGGCFAVLLGSGPAGALQYAVVSSWCVCFCGGRRAVVVSGCGVTCGVSRLCVARVWRTHGGARGRYTLTQSPRAVCAAHLLLLARCGGPDDTLHTYGYWQGTQPQQHVYCQGAACCQACGPWPRVSVQPASAGGCMMQNTSLHFTPHLNYTAWMLWPCAVHSAVRLHHWQRSPQVGGHTPSIHVSGGVVSKQLVWCSAGVVGCKGANVRAQTNADASLSPIGCRATASWVHQCCHVWLSHRRATTTVLGRRCQCVLGRMAGVGAVAIKPQRWPAAHKCLAQRLAGWCAAVQQVLGAVGRLAAAQ
jgi:hypothetical protein